MRETLDSQIDTETNSDNQSIALPKGYLAGGDPVEEKRRQFRQILLSGSDVSVYPTGEIETKKTYWYLFVSSLDREEDITLIKELLFWEHLYHKQDSKIEILVPGANSTNGRISFMRRTFKVTLLPTLILTDRPIYLYPNSFIKISPGFFSENFIGKDFEKLRDLMDYFQNAFMLSNSMDKLKLDILKKHLSTIIMKSWSEMKGLISINIG
ncbi:MAG: hypothetical protein GYA60_03105 [Candidatus Methanofastidiosa archaeon]|nr:hypothetical protein [Candidatus Methanofastidiosa archaeon]